MNKEIPKFAPDSFMMENDQDISQFEQPKKTYQERVERMLENVEWAQIESFQKTIAALMAMTYSKKMPFEESRELVDQIIDVAERDISDDAATELEDFIKNIDSNQNAYDFIFKGLERRNLAQLYLDGELILPSPRESDIARVSTFQKLLIIPGDYSRDKFFSKVNTHLAFDFGRKSLVVMDVNGSLKQKPRPNKNYSIIVQNEYSNDKTRSVLGDWGIELQLEEAKLEEQKLKSSGSEELKMQGLTLNEYLYLFVMDYLEKKNSGVINIQNYSEKMLDNGTADSFLTDEYIEDNDGTAHPLLARYDKYDDLGIRVLTKRFGRASIRLALGLKEDYE